MPFNDLLGKFHTQLLFIAPPGWGKTSILLELFKGEELFFYVAPLKAICLEFYHRIQGEFDVILINKKHEGLKLKRVPKIIISTVEAYDERILSLYRSSSPIVILDEFHLFRDWINFRPHLEDMYLSLVCSNCSVLLLTATFSKDHLEFFELAQMIHFDHSYIIDLGNFSLKTRPKNIFFFLTMNKLFELHYHYQSTIVIFVPYRQLVKQIVKTLKQRKISALGCIGGEVDQFREELKVIKNPTYIISTIALSHGVNLPRPSAVVITISNPEEAMLTQMLGRGGRNGEDFDVFFPFNRYYWDRSDKFQSVTSSLMLKLILGLKKWKQKFKELF